VPAGATGLDAAGEDAKNAPLASAISGAVLHVAAYG
jgi:hypothetical protein